MWKNKIKCSFILIGVFMLLSSFYSSVVVANDISIAWDSPNLIKDGTSASVAICKDTMVISYDCKSSGTYYNYIRLGKVENGSFVKWRGHRIKSPGNKHEIANVAICDDIVVVGYACRYYLTPNHDVYTQHVRIGKINYKDGVFRWIDDIDEISFNFKVYHSGASPSVAIIRKPGGKENKDYRILVGWEGTVGTTTFTVGKRISKFRIADITINRNINGNNDSFKWVGPTYEYDGSFTNVAISGDKAIFQNMCHLDTYKKTQIITRHSIIDEDGKRSNPKSFYYDHKEYTEYGIGISDKVMIDFAWDKFSIKDNYDSTASTLYFKKDNDPLVAVAVFGNTVVKAYTNNKGCLFSIGKIE